MNRKNQNGMALPLVLIISAFLVFLGSVMLNQEVGETVFRVNNEDKTQAYYHARAGAEAVYDVFLNDKVNALLLLQNNKYTATPTSFADGEISVAVTDNRHVQVGGHNKNEILIVSTGTVGNATEVVTMDLIFTPAATGYNVFQYPLYSKGEIEVGAEFDFALAGGGKIATELPDDTDVTLLPQTNITTSDIDFNVDGSMYTTPIFPVGTDIGDVTLNNNSDVLTIRKDPTTGLVTVHENGTDLTGGGISGAIYLPNFTATKGKVEVYVPINESLKMVSDVFDTKIELEVFSLDTDGSLWTDTYPIDDKGTADTSDDTLDFVALNDGSYTGDLDGVFELYATTEMTFQTGAAVIANTPNAFFAVMADGADFTFIANGEFSGYIYGPGAAVDIQASGSDFSGAIIGNTVEISNGADYEFYPFFATDIPSGFMDSANYGIAIQSWK